MSVARAPHTKILPLEGLRGVMAWWVVLGHLSLAMGWNLPVIDRNGLAVDVFIVLSGFVIAGLIDRRNEPFAPYITRRIFRLAPLYLVVLLVSAALLPVQLFAWETLPDTARNAGRVELVRLALDDLPAHLAVHLPLAQGVVPNHVLPQAAFTILGQAWSISLEMQFYLIAPLAMWALRRWDRLALLLTIGGVLLALGPQFGSAFIGNKLFLFAAGIFAAKAAAQGGSLRWIAATMLAAGGAVWQDGVWVTLPLAMIGIVLIATLSDCGPLRPLAQLLGTRALVHQGEISYSTYLIHMIPLYGTAAVCAALGIDGWGKAAAITLATLGGTYLIALVTYRWIEQPARDWGTALARRMQASHSTAV